MFKDFEIVTGQLRELADVVNKFKSEAVQLRLLELLFTRGAPTVNPASDSQVLAPAAERVRRKVRRKSAAKSASQIPDGEKPAKKAIPSGDGAVATLVRLHTSSDFFQTPRTIRDILDHCETNLARRIRANEISGKLGRMVRNGDLQRQKNQDGQYQYTKP